MAQLPAADDGTNAIIRGMEPTAAPPSVARELYEMEAAFIGVDPGRPGGDGVMTFQVPSTATLTVEMVRDAVRRSCDMRERMVRNFTVDLGAYGRTEMFVPYAGAQQEVFGDNRRLVMPPLVRRDDAEAMAERNAAIARGETLLREWLSPAQRTQYDSEGYFEVIGCHTRRRYRIGQAEPFNVKLLRASGAVEEEICFLPEGGLVNGDVMLAQKVAIETDENAALAVANRQYLGPERGAITRMQAVGFDWRIEPYRRLGAVFIDTGS